MFKRRVRGGRVLIFVSAGIHTWQLILGCELDDDGTKRGYSKYSYDGEDFLILDPNTLTWTAANDKAAIIKQQWDSTTRATTQKNFVDSDCIQRLQKHLDYGRATLEGKGKVDGLICNGAGFKQSLIS